MFAMGTDNFVVAGILPSVASSLGTSVSLAGQMVAVYALSFAILAPVTAAVGGGWPRKPMLVVALNVSANGGLLMVYTYAGLVLDRATGGSERTLATVLLVWGVSATVGNLFAGRLVDRFGSRSVMNASLAIAIAVFCALPWASASMAGTVVSLVLWGFCGWAVIVPQQHRLVKIAPKVAPLLLALNNTATYGGLACSSMLGGLVLLFIDRHYLSLIGAAMILAALVLAEATHAIIARRGARAHGSLSELQA
ncbi:MFS transporter [Variovorax sp. LT1R20]|uniref:MFS transporter n=1 Tax=Variovorax sp. LT1R20 TaxID=3443729 RepID=UPI003F454CE8